MGAEGLEPPTLVLQGRKEPAGQSVATFGSSTCEYLGTRGVRALQRKVLGEIAVFEWGRVASSWSTSAIRA